VYDDGLGDQAALWCDVYYMVNGIVKNIGQIESMGTAYPIAYDETGIYGISGQDIESFSINEREGTLQLSEGDSEQYHEATIVSFTPNTSTANQ
jgi:6-phosphogluconolactonase (cycloisomerase 2 family)